MTQLNSIQAIEISKCQLAVKGKLNKYDKGKVNLQLQKFDRYL